MEKKEFKIYKITNLINGKIYIGQTRVAFCSRISAYKRDIKRHLSGKYSGKSAIIYAMAKYGMDNFKFEIIDNSATNKDLLNDLEIKYIEQYKSIDKNIGYNILPGGSVGPDITGCKNPMWGKFGPLNPFFGKRHTPEVIRYLSQTSKIANLGKKYSAETCEKIRKSHIGKIVSQEARKNMSLARKGMPLKKKGFFLKCLNCNCDVYVRPNHKATREDKKDNKSYCSMKCYSLHLKVRVVKENNPNAKLTQEIADQLREYYKSLTCNSVKEKIKLTKDKFGVGNKTIWEITTNRRWVK